jgi:RimJ/RimL family protein N-acetyltransferase
VNPEAKYLLLKNAFDAHFNRVEFKTDARNTRSRAALLKLGAKEEGILRGHMWVPQGYFRDSVYFSILASEWPQICSNLETRLAAYA